MVAGCLQGQLTRIAGRDVRVPDGHTVGKTSRRKALLEYRQPLGPPRGTPAPNPLTPASVDQHQSVDPTQLRRHNPAGLQHGTRETGFSQALTGLPRAIRALSGHASSLNVQHPDKTHLLLKPFSTRDLCAYDPPGLSEMLTPTLWLPEVDHAQRHLISSLLR